VQFYALIETSFARGRAIAAGTLSSALLTLALAASVVAEETKPQASAPVASPDAAPVAPQSVAPVALPPPATPVAQVALPPRPERISIKAFSATAFIDDPKLSPSGDRVAARMNLKGREVVGVVYLDKKGRTPSLASTGEHDLRWFRWAGEDRLIISLGVTTRWQGVEVYVTRLLAYELATGKAQYLGMKSEGIVGDDVLHVANDGSFILLAVAKDIWSYPAVYRIDLATAEMKRILPPKPPIYDWYADTDGVVRIGPGYSNGKIKIVYREKEEDKFETIAKLSLEDLEGDIEKVTLGPGDKGYVVSNAKTGRFALYEFNSKTFEFGKTIFEHPTVDLDDFQLSANGDEVVAVYYTDDRERVQWFDPAMKALQEEIDRALPGRMNWVSSSSRDRKRLVVWSGTADDPGHYYFYDRTAKRMDRLATPHELLLEKPLAPVKPVTYRAHDGLEIPAYLTLPVGREPKNLPVVLVPHGGPHVRDKWEYDAWVQFLANRGYAVLQPNFRGSSGYGTDYLAKGFGQWGAGMQDDLTDGVQWLISEGIADPKRICIMGASYGGYAALMGAIRTPELYRCAISFAGVTDVNDMMRYDRSQMLPSRYKRWRQKVRGEAEVDLKSVSPVYRSGEVGVPLLLMHGTVDGNVPYRQAENFVAAMKKVGKPLEFVKMDDVGHGLHSEAARTVFFTSVEAFLQRHNPAE
jgi:dipeptidyl aminopeptidase/acylaminoacyl peptidase